MPNMKTETRYCIIEAVKGKPNAFALYPGYEEDGRPITYATQQEAIDKALDTTNERIRRVRTGECAFPADNIAFDGWVEKVEMNPDGTATMEHGVVIGRREGLNAESRSRLDKARRYGDVTRGLCPVCFEWGLQNKDGGWFRLLREHRHSDKDIEIAKNYLRNARDVVSLTVERLT